MTSGLLERELDSGSSEPSPEEEDEEDKEADDVESESRIKRRRGDNLESVGDTNGSTLKVLSEQNPEASAMEDMCAHPGSFGDLSFLCGQRLIEQAGVTFGYILEREDYQVWASKWKAKLDHENICMAVLIQEIICADYAFVIHTKNPLIREYCRNLQRDS